MGVLSTLHLGAGPMNMAQQDKEKRDLLYAFPTDGANCKGDLARSLKDIRTITVELGICISL